MYEDKHKIQGFIDVSIPKSKKKTKSTSPSKIKTSNLNTKTSTTLKAQKSIQSESTLQTYECH